MMEKSNIVTVVVLPEHYTINHNVSAPNVLMELSNSIINVKNNVTRVLLNKTDNAEPCVNKIQYKAEECALIHVLLMKTILKNSNIVWVVRNIRID